MIGRYGRTARVLNSANFQQVNFQLMKDARTVRPYLSSGKSAEKLFHQNFRTSIGNNIGVDPIPQTPPPFGHLP